MQYYTLRCNMSLETYMYSIYKYTTYKWKQPQKLQQHNTNIFLENLVELEELVALEYVKLELPLE